MKILLIVSVLSFHAQARRHEKIPYVSILNSRDVPQKIISKDVSGIYIQHSHILNADWSDSLFHGAQIQNSVFRNVNFSSSEFRDCRILWTRFINCTIPQDAFKNCFVFKVEIMNE